jgi:hypothetical protein
MVDYDEIANVLNERSERQDYESTGIWIDVTCDGTPSALGAGHARYLLEEMGVIMVKARPVDDSLRMWFADIEHEEVEVTTTEERFTF